MDCWHCAATASSDIINRGGSSSSSLQVEVEASVFSLQGLQVPRRLRHSVTVLRVSTSRLQGKTYRSSQVFPQFSHASTASSPDFGGIRRHFPRRCPSRVIEFAGLSSGSNIRHCDGQADAHNIRAAIFRTHHNNFRNLPLRQLRFSCGCRYQLCVTGVVNIGLG